VADFGERSGCLSERVYDRSADGAALYAADRGDQLLKEGDIGGASNLAANYDRDRGTAAGQAAGRPSELMEGKAMARSTSFFSSLCRNSLGSSALRLG
jgi:hypothetical protein